MPRLRIRIFVSAATLLAAGSASWAQNAGMLRMTPSPAAQAPASSMAPDAGRELQTGSELTRQGYLREAIPHLLAARRAGVHPYATGVNLGICYLGTGQAREAIAVLHSLEASGRGNATVENLLSQAYLANGDDAAALRTFQRAARLDPKNEKVYAYMADACTDRKDYELGLKIVESGLEQLPNSARLHYEKALFLSELGSFGQARADFDRAAQLAPGSYIGYLAQVQEALYEGDLAAADRILHAAIQAGHRDYRMLSLLGTVLLHEGVIPGQAKFDEAQAALEESAREQPDYPATQIALGKMDLMQGKAKEAVQHLEAGRRLEPANPAVYASLADAYELLGERAKARAVRQELGRLVAAPASASGPR